MQLEEAEKILRTHRQELFQRGVRKLALFGSTVRNQAKPSSDIDILVDFEAKRGMFLFVNLKIYLEKILKCKVDLVTKNSLHPALKKRILSEAKEIF